MFSLSYLFITSSINSDKLKIFPKDTYEKEKLDTMLNVPMDWISKFDEEMQNSGFSEYKDHRLVDKMTDRERELFVVVRSIGNKQITFLLDAISKLLKKEDGHDYRDSKNKAEAHKKKKFSVSIAGLNNQINRLNELDPTKDTAIYTKQQLSTIIDDLTDILIDLKIETGVDV